MAEQTSSLWREDAIDDYFIFSTSLSVFLWQVLYTGAFNFYLGYVVVIANTLLLFARGELLISRGQVIFLIGLGVMSTVASVISHNPLRSTIAQETGIAVFLIYHFTVFYRTRFSLERIIETYAAWATVAAICGYPLWIIHKLEGETLYRFHSWFAEPSHYVYATLPAVSYWLLKAKKERTLDIASLPLLLSYILADSSTGYLGVGITLLLMAKARSLKTIVATVILLSAASYATYMLSENLRLRINETLQSEVQSEAEATALQPDQTENPTFGANATTFALISNAYVAWKAFLDSPVIGNGLGTHTRSYEKYAPDIVSPNFIMFGLNRDDANSLILRLASETGLVGLAATFVLIFWFGRVEGDWHIMVRNAILPYFVLRLVRFGAYFSLENFFFIMIYGFNWLDSRGRAALPQPYLRHD